MINKQDRHILFYDVFPVSAGWIAVLATAAGLTGISLPQKTATRAQRVLGEKIEEAAHTLERFRDLAGRLQAYFNGLKTDFPDKIDFSGTTSFQREVWQATRLIPYGQTRSYHWVATQIGRPGSARAVGQALGDNRLPIIVPCHRVITANGKLGGFGGGIKMKRHLLKLERTIIPP